MGNLSSKNDRLHDSAEMGGLAEVIKLIEDGADVNSYFKSYDGLINETPLFAAAKNGHVEVARCLLQNGAAATVLDKFGNNALHIAAGYDHRDVTELILLLTPPENLDINLQNLVGETATHRAASVGSHEALNVLIDYDADLHIKNKSGNTALHCAAMGGFPMCCDLILKFGDKKKNRKLENDQGEVAWQLAEKSKVLEVFSKYGIESIDDE